MAFNPEPFLHVTENEGSSGEESPPIKREPIQAEDSGSNRLGIRKSFKDQDVEGSNQCPVFHSTPQEHLNWVYKLVLIFFIRNYYPYGQELGIASGLLDAFLNGSNDKEEVCKQVLKEWVNGHGESGFGKKDKSWDTIWAAIHAIDPVAARTMGDELQKLEQESSSSVLCRRNEDVKESYSLMLAECKKRPLLKCLQELEQKSSLSSPVLPQWNKDLKASYYRMLAECKDWTLPKCSQEHNKASSTSSRQQPICGPAEPESSCVAVIKQPQEPVSEASRQPPVCDLIEPEEVCTSTHHQICLPEQIQNGIPSIEGSKTKKKEKGLKFLNFRKKKKK